MGRTLWRLAVAVLFSALVALPGYREASAQPSATSARVELLFAEKDNLARDYVEWVFGYSSSYVSSYLLAAKIIPYAIKEPRDAVSQLSRLKKNYYQERFRTQVLKPDEGTDEFVSLLKNVLDGRLIEKSYSIARTKCEQQKHSCFQIELERLANLRYLTLEHIDQSEVRSLAHRELWSAMEAKAELVPGSVRFARPFIIRGFLIIVRVTEFLSILFIVGVALRAFYVPVTGITLIIGASTMALLIDYGIHDFDRYLHKSDYASSVQSLLEDGKKNFKTVLVRLLDEHEMRFIAAAADGH